MQVLIGNRRGSTRMWGCVGGYAAYTPPHPGFITVNPNDPSTIKWYSKKYMVAHQNEQIIRDNEVKLERLVKSLNVYEKYLRITNDLLINARDEAEKARNVKQIFVQNVRHELRTLLNLIIGFSETMINTPENYGGVHWTLSSRETWSASTRTASISNR